MSSKKSEAVEAPDRGVCNATYLMILLNNQLSKWAKTSKVSNGKGNLTFILSIESSKLDDVFLSLSYTNGDHEEVIPAGYIGQTLTETEEKFSKKLPFFTINDLMKRPPYDVVMQRLAHLHDDSGIISVVAKGYEELMINTCNIARGVNGALATKNGAALLFLENNGYITKIEIYTKDILDFVARLDESRTKNVREVIQSILTK